MAKFTDGKRTVEIVIKEWDESSQNWTPDWSNDFFTVGGLPIVNGINGDAYKVDDVDYCIEYADDWQNGVGDFAEDRENCDFDPTDRMVDVNEI